MEQRRYGEAEQFLKDTAAATERRWGRSIWSADRLQKLANSTSGKASSCRASGARARGRHQFSPENDGPREIHILGV